MAAKLSFRSRILSAGFRRNIGETRWKQAANQNISAPPPRLHDGIEPDVGAVGTKQRVDTRVDTPYPNVAANSSIPASRNSIWNCLSSTGEVWRTI
jgi:hypothetical protein